MSNENLYRRGEVWWLRATVAGREVRESLRCRDVKAARKIRDKRIAEIADALHRGVVRRSWEEAVTAWAEHCVGQVAGSTAKRYGVSLNQVAPFLLGADVSRIDGQTIQALVQARRRAGATAATVRRDLTAISRVLEHAEALGWREGNPTLSKRRLLKERRDPVVLPEAKEIEAVIAASSARIGALIRAAWLTGCRQDEIVCSTWRAFNPQARTLEIIGKGNKRRTIQLSTEASAHFSTQPRSLTSDLIFASRNGLPIASPSSAFAKARAMAAKADPTLRRFRFHDLRHLFAVEALRGGMGIYRLSQHLGHTSVGITERVYLAFLTPEEAQKTKDKAA